MLKVLRQHWRFFVMVGLAGFLFRLLFVFRFPAVTTDSFIYGDIAKNWLQAGVYGITDSPGVILPTFIRLPGYPAFLASIFAIFGMEHYRAVLFVQVFVDLGTCLIIADIAYRLTNSRTAKLAFLLSALCPFLAQYAAAALTETLEVFFTALTLDCVLVALATARNRAWLIAGMCAGAAILLRPDGGLLLLSVELCLLAKLALASGGSNLSTLKAGALFGLMAILPLVPWTARNYFTLHRFQPLAPRYANEVNEFVPAGFNRWVKTWIIDYASVEEVYWPVPGEELEASKLPQRAFDSPEKRVETEQLFANYNEKLYISSELDARFSRLAAERIRSHPLRYYLWLPSLRVVDMWLRPRTETLPSDSRWWEFNDDPKGSALAVSMGVVGVAYVLAALTGLARAARLPNISFLLAFVVIRSVFLGTLENPEPRYTLECFPVIIVLAALAVTNRGNAAATG